MKTLCKIGLMLGFVLTPALARAASPWTLQAALEPPSGLKLAGSLRLRYEGLDGQFRPGARETQGLTSLRTILSAEYAAGATRVFGELHDSRVYGGHADGVVTTNEVNTLELVQAYVAHEITGPRGKLTGQLGRFMLNLGSRRLVAADDYRNTTNSYSGLKLDATTRRGETVTLIYVAPISRRPDDIASVLDNRQGVDRESRDAILWGGNASTAPSRDGTAADIAFYGFEERDHGARATRDRDLRTLSARLIRTPRPGHWDLEAEAAYQFGSISADLTAAARRLDVAADFVHLDAGYQFADPWKTHVNVEYDRASGDDGRASYGRFDTLFGFRRGEFGPSGVYAAAGRANIATPGLRIEVTPSKRIDAFVVYRGLWAASATDSFSTTGVRDASGRSGHFAGRQLEGRLRYWLVPNQLRLEFNGAWLDKAGLLRTAPNAPRTGDTRYLTAAVTASF